MFLFVTTLFFVLTPGIVLTLPPKSSKYIVAIVHGIVFALIWYFTHTLVWDAIDGPSSNYVPIPPPMYVPPSAYGPISTYGTINTRFQ